MRHLLLDLDRITRLIEWRPELEYVQRGGNRDEEPRVGERAPRARTAAPPEDEGGGVEDVRVELTVLDEALRVEPVWVGIRLRVVRAAPTVHISA